jgi:hypothetical protein
MTDAGPAPTTGHDLDVAAVRARVNAYPDELTQTHIDALDLCAEVDRLTRERDDARRLVGNVEALHTPETRWQPHPDADYSFDTKDEALADMEADDEDDLHTFQVCSHCGSIEMLVDQCDDGHAYQNSLWPCETRAALAGDTDRPDSETEGEGL